MEMPMNILILNTNIMKNMYSRVGREGKQRLAGCQGTNYVVKPTFRYLNGDMRGVDWRSNLASTSMAPGRKICFLPGPCLGLSNRCGTRRNLLVKTF